MNAIVSAEEARQIPGAVEASGQTNDSRALMVLIERLATSETCDLERIEKLLALKERWEADQARKAFVAAMADFKRDPPHIVKNKLVSFTTSKGTTEYRHATHDEVTMKIAAALAKHELSHGWKVEQSQSSIKVTCTVTHAMGHSESVSMHALADDSGGKNAIQQIASTVTYLQRYTLLAITGLSSADMADVDDDGRAGGVTTKGTPPEGYEALKKHLGETARKGTRELRIEWQKAAESLRTYAASHDAQWWNGTKEVAEQVDRQSKAVQS